MNLMQIPEIKELMEKISEVQGEWDGVCGQTDCYWNMWHPTILNGTYSCDDSKLCVSESLNEFKMTPNSINCPGYLSYLKFCGCNKGE